MKSNHNDQILEAIRDAFKLGTEAFARPLGNGHINQTVLVHDGGLSLVAQRINTTVFKAPQALVDNSRKIVAHLEHKERAPRVARTLAGEDGNFLYGVNRDIRVLEYIQGSRSVDIVESPDQAREVAETYARFCSALSDIDQQSLKTVIPDFHKPSLRFQNFLDVLKHATESRIDVCRAEVEFVKTSNSLITQWQSLIDGLPIRVCHNDCKINNVLLSEDDAKPIAVIDLDTCMPGCLITDFGDLVRSCCSPEGEDSIALERVVARPDVFAALAEGFLKGLSGVILPQEVESLASGALMVCFIQGVRFLTDFLAGDCYYPVDQPLHNLHRARNQFQLFRSLQVQESEFKRRYLSQI